MKLIPQSIRWRIQLWHTLLLAAIVAALLFAFHQNQREILYQALDRELRSPITRLLPQFERRREPPRRSRRIPRPDDFELGPGDFREGPPGERGGPRRPSLDDLVAELAEKDIFLIVRGRGGELTYSSENAPDEPRPVPEERPRGSDRFSKRTAGGYREAIHASQGGGFLLLGASVAPLEEKLASLQTKLIGTGVLIVAGGFLVGWLLIGRSLKPIREISETAHRIEEGDLSDRIKTKEEGSELGKLATVLNETFEKLESSFEHQVRFTADASHEMRTPIAVILAKSQFALSRERSPEKYQEALQTCMESAQHMRTLTDGLLELSKMDSGEFDLRKEEGNLGELTKEILAMIEPLADEKKITIKHEVASARTKFDPQKMRQALLNLLSNAVKYGVEEGQIEMRLIESDDKLILSIHDDGPGIAAEAIPHVFERFYRVDRARTHGGKSGTGLGLAITKAIIEAHDGRIEVVSEPGKGTEFRVTLPNLLG